MWICDWVTYRVQLFYDYGVTGGYDEKTTFVIIVNIQSLIAIR
jgi:hypothetical protein